MGGGEGQVDATDESWALSARAAFAPVRGPSGLLHTGLAASYRAFDDGRIRFRARPESFLADVFLVDTGAITDVDEVLRYGLEAAAVVGPFSFQSEYIGTNVRRKGGRSNLDFDGWYVYASYSPTGESRPYDGNRGVFERIAPYRPLGGKGLGAWELGLRYSHLDLSDEDVIGGTQDLITLGLNWYPNFNTRLMANYIRVLDVDRPGRTFDGAQADIVQIRGQMDF